MSATYLNLGKSGDIISSLPILYAEWLETKIKPGLIVARQYASLLDRVTFINSHIYPGEWYDLKGALKWAKQKFNKVVPLSVFGKDFPVEHRTSSFQLETWKRAGKLEQWDSLSLSGLMNGDEAIAFKRPTILFADHSQSSPFFGKEDIHKLLTKEFPEHEILRLSTVKLPHLFDFLKWYDAAKAIVCVDSAHLHLSAATKTPVAALTQDRPSRWHGSAWSKRFCFYCRYSELEGRKAEFVEALRDAISGKIKPEMVEWN